MEDRNFKGMKRYDSLLKTVCMVEDYSLLPEAEWEGCIGMACVISAIEGVNTTLFSFAKHLDIPHYDSHLQKAFERLRVNGVFSNKYNAKGDPFLTGRASDGGRLRASERERNAWCMIAGVSAGFMGIQEKNYDEEY